MKVLITGIGNVGKSTLREEVARRFPADLTQIDMDYCTNGQIMTSCSKHLLVEDVHGLERNPEQYDRIVYLMPPGNHTWLWMKRGWAWFSNGVVDLSEPKGIRKRYALVNIPTIVAIVTKNILSRRRWILADMETITHRFRNRTIVAESIEMGAQEMENLLLNQRED